MTRLLVAIAVVFAVAVAAQLIYCLTTVFGRIETATYHLNSEVLS